MTKNLSDPSNNNAAKAKGHLISSDHKDGDSKSTILLYTIVAFLVFTLGWASYAELDKVTRGTGKVIPSREMQIIQNLEGGIVERILVREGDVVEAGEPLLILDKTILNGEYEQGQQQKHTLQAKTISLMAQINETKLKFPEELTLQTPEVIITETLLYNGKKAELYAQIRLLKTQAAQRDLELEEAKVALKTAQESIGLIEREIALLKPLTDSGLEPEINIIKLQRSLVESKGKMQTTVHKISRTKSAIQEVYDKISAAEEKHKTDALTDLSNVTNQMSELMKVLPALEAKVARTELKAPVRGIINRLFVNTEGGVARAGEPLAELVPLDDTLVVEANINPKDIAFLHVGQQVQVKITAYDFAKYGGLVGELITISADAVQISDSESSYVIQVRTDQSSIVYNEEELEIIPGMIAEVNILTGKQTIMDYILTPILKVKDRAFRE